MVKDWIVVSVVFLLSGASLTHADCTILAKDCEGKTRYVIDRDPGEGTGTECGCPCNSATWMGIKGIYYTPKDGEIWYRFPCETAKYTVTIDYKGDRDGYAKFRLYVTGQKIGEGTIGHSSGQQTFGPVCINKGDEIKVWLRSDYSTGAKDGKHGNYGRFNKLIFKKVGSCGGSPPPEPGNVSNLTVSSVGQSSATLSWNAGRNAENYLVSWTGGGSATTANTSYTVAGLSAETDYTATVKANNVTGTASGISTSFTTTAPQPAQYASVPVQINIGAAAQDGFLADQQWQDNAAYGYTETGSKSVVGTGEVSGTDDDAVFRSVRYKSFDYRVRVPNGEYEVSLLFAEFWRESAGGRTFQVAINETPVASEPLDIFAEAGANAALIKKSTVSVSDELIVVSFTRVVSDPMISGIIVETAASTATAQIDVTSPSSGQTYSPGQPLTTAWTTAQPLHTNLVIDISLDGGRVWTQILDKAIADTVGKFVWTIPELLPVYDQAAGKPVNTTTASADAKIMVYDYDNHDVKGVSGTFAIESQGVDNALHNYGSIEGACRTEGNSWVLYDLKGRRLKSHGAGRDRLSAKDAVSGVLVARQKFGSDRRGMLLVTPLHRKGR